MTRTLSQKFVAREVFDPTNKAHTESLQTFIRTGNWGDVQFYAEEPYIETPITVLLKFAQHALGVRRESPEEQRMRLAEKVHLISAPRAPRMSELAQKRAKQLQRSNTVLATLLNAKT